ncbi:hypothetical protein [Rheinheimera nanhaiensis]|uniref:hypothetical protein n=1 Tax=Rheinheimera nanhaiensis TaxID=1163621 RepID=UPI0011D28E43|nr:hypothetical protein [Rheinheimera nanhaiensis]
MHPMLIIAVRAARYTGIVVTFIRMLLARLCCQVLPVVFAKTLPITVIAPLQQYPSQNKPLSNQCCFNALLRCAGNTGVLTI